MIEYPRPSSFRGEAKAHNSFPFHKSHFYPPRRLQGHAAPTLFWPALTLLLAACVSLSCWAAYNLLPRHEFGVEKYLRQAQFSSKVNPTSAAPGPTPTEPVFEYEPEEEGPAAPAALPATVITEITAPPPPAIEAPPPPQPVELPKAELPAVVDQLPPLLPAPPPLEIQPAKLVAAADAVGPPDLLAEMETNPLVYRESTSGDTPMLRNWQTLALYSLLTTTVFVQVPAPATAQEKDETVLERIKALSTTIDANFKAMKAEIAALNKKIKDDDVTQGLENNKVKERISNLETAVEEIRASLKAGVDKATLDGIKAKLETIEQAVLKLQPTTKQISLSPPVSPPTGRVMLINLYGEELLFIVNNKGHRVPPGATMPLDNVAAGPLSYEVFSQIWGPQPRRTTNLAANETFTLTAR